MNIHPPMTAESLQEHIASGPALPRHIVSMRDFSRPMVEHCCSSASLIERAPPATYAHFARGRCMGVMFYQQSTRTRLSFESAMLRIGGHIIGFADPTTTRAVGFYEETLEDVVRFTAEMADLLVLRHTETGAGARAASVSAVPIINAGDGYGEHPTQALGDLYHIFKHFGRIDGLTIGIVGHLGWRAHRSLVIGLSLFGVRLVVLEPPGATVPRDVETILRQRGVPYTLADKIDDVLQSADIVTTLGVHHADFHAEFGEEKKSTAKQSSPTPRDYYITADAVARLTRIVPIMHMGPIADHIDRALDRLPQAHYFKQARDGVWMRAALLGNIFLKAV